jgi:general secretion pathway protein M
VILNMRADRSTIVVGSTLGILLLLVLYWVLHFWFLRQGFVEEIETIEPRTARVLGIMQSASQLEAASSAANNRLRELTYGADRDSAATAAAMQQEIRELMTDAGLSISGSQILPPRKFEGFDRLSLDITAEGNIEALDAALSALEALRPLVFVAAMKVNPERSTGRVRLRQAEAVVVGDPRKLTARLQLFSLRLQP